MEYRQAEVESRVAAVEAELRRLGRWLETKPRDPDANAESWLQFSVLPALRAAALAHGPIEPVDGLTARTADAWTSDPAAEDLLLRVRELNDLLAEPLGAEDAEALATARRFLTAVAARDLAAARAELLPAQRDGDFSPPPLASFGLSRPESRENVGRVIQAALRERDEDGATRTMALPLVVVRDGGRACIDMARSAALMFGGGGTDPEAQLEAVLEGAMQGVADQMNDAMSEFDRARKAREHEEFEAVLHEFQTERMQQHIESLSEALGTQVTLTIDRGAIEDDASALSRLDRWLSNEAFTALRTPNSETCDALRARVQSIAVVTSPHAADVDVALGDDGTLRFVLAPARDGGLPDGRAFTRPLELEVDAELAPRAHHLRERMAAGARMLADEFGVDVPVEMNWQVLCAGRDANADAWALYQMAETGVDPAFAALAGVLREEKRALDAARDGLRSIRFETAPSQEEQGWGFEDGELMFFVHAAEGAAGLDDAAAMTAGLKELLLGG